MLAKTPLVVVGEESLRFSKVLFEVGVSRCVDRPSEIRAGHFQRLPRGVILLDAHDSPIINP